ncbi:MAG TPA: hypothetical protein VK851_04755 [Anaerolineales bacterium]|nr:hypothetical protein [Anaerolineales bacterium]
MNVKRVVSGAILLSGWSSMLLSIVFYLFFWRVDNEPGAKDVPALLWAAISFCSLGGLEFLGGNIYLIKEKSWMVLVVALVVCIALLVGAISLSPILLLFMV